MTIRKLLRATAVAAGMIAIPQFSIGAHRGDEPGPTGDPWAIGYAVQASRSCPNWEVEPQETLAQRGVLVRPAVGSGVMPLDGPFQRDYYRGQADADSYEDFCRRLPKVTGTKWRRLARVLRTTSTAARTVPQHPSGRVP